MKYFERLKKYFQFFEKYKEIFLYLFFGGLTFLVSIASFMLFLNIFNLRPTVANCISWIISVIFAYFTNKKWVFNVNDNGKRQCFSLFFKFIISRIITLIIEEIIIWIFIEKMYCLELPIKIIAQIIVIASNYIMSKIWIFRIKN